MNDNVVVPITPAVPAEWANELAKYAEEARESERAAGTFFSTKSGQLSFGGVPVPNNTMDVVAVASLHERVFYPESYSTDKPNSPMCYSFSPNGVDMVPHAESHTKQAATCKQCPWDKYETDRQGGAGKGCKQMRRLALMPESALASPEEVARAVVGYLRVPVTSVKNWSAHVQAVAARAVPPFAVVTRVRLVPDAKSMFKAEFTFVRQIVDTALLGAIALRANAEKGTIAFPYPPREDRTDDAKAGKGKAAKPDTDKSKY